MYKDANHKRLSKRNGHDLTTWNTSQDGIVQNTRVTLSGPLSDAAQRCRVRLQCSHQQHNSDTDTNDHHALLIFLKTHTMILWLYPRASHQSLKLPNVNDLSLNPSLVRWTDRLSLSLYGSSCSQWYVSTMVTNHNPFWELTNTRLTLSSELAEFVELRRGHCAKEAWMEQLRSQISFCKANLNINSNLELQCGQASASNWTRYNLQSASTNTDLLKSLNKIIFI